MNERHFAERLMIVLLIILVVVGVPAAVLLYNNRTPHISIPTHKMPNPNAWDGFGRAAALAPKFPSYGPLSRSDKKVQDWTVADYRADYAAFTMHSSATIAELKKSLRQPYMHPTANPSVMPFPSYAGIRELARISTSKALYQNALGRPGDAMDSFLDVVDLGVTVPRGGPLIADLVGIAVESISYSHIGETAIVGKLNSAELARAAHRLELTAAKRTSFGNVLIEEGYLSAALCSYEFGDSDIRRSRLNPGKWAEIGSGLGGRSTVESFWFGSRLAFEDKSAVVRQDLAYWQAIAAEQSKGYTGKSSVQEPKNFFSQSVLGGTFTDMVVGSSAHHARAEANLALLQTEIALRRYKLDSGGYPKSLVQLRPKYLKKLPADPFGKRKPLCYKLTNGGKSFLLYSRGPDMTDDGGKPGKWSATSTQGDFFFAAR